MTYTTVPATLQEWFDRAWQHAIVEGRPPSVEGTRCRYRKGKIAPDPCRCFIGLGIPDDQYSESMESLSLASVLDGLGVRGNLYGILSSLQVCHDASATSGDYGFAVRLRLSKFAADYGLAIPQAA